MDQDWEDQARNWIAWARTPGLDSYWRYRSAFFELIPAPGSSTLDLGCGEGRAGSRRLSHRVIGIDVSPTLLEASREAHPDGTYLVSDAATLPFPGNSFDLVVAYNFLMDADDLPGCVREAASVLNPGCKLALSVLHPANTGKIVGEGDDAAFLVDGSYFEGGHNYQEVDRDGVHMVSAPATTTRSAITHARSRTRDWSPRPFANLSRPGSTAPPTSCRGTSGCEPSNRLDAP